MRKQTAAILALLAVLVLAACGLGAEPQEQAGGFTIYYLAQKGEAKGSDAIQSSYEQLELEADASLRETAAAVVERLLQGPADGSLDSPIPANVELLSLKIQDRRACVDLSSGFHQLSGVELLLADYCLTLSLTALDGIDAVSITAQGRAVAQQPKQVFYERDVLLSTMDDVLKTVDVTLYFLNSDGLLTGEERTLELYEGQTLAESLIAAFLAGPQDRELTAVIPEGFQVASIHVENGVCYVNLPAASLELLPEDAAAQEQILWSLAESLYSINSIEELRFLSDGAGLTKFGEISLETVGSRPKG